MVLIRRLWPLALFFLAPSSLAELLGCSAPSRQAEAPSPALATTATSARMTLPRLGGGTISLESLRGHPVVVHLFTTWCLRCQAEAPFFARMHEQLSGRGLRTLGVALDKGVPELVKTYVEYVGFRFPVLLALPDDLELVAGLGRTPQVPRTILLDPQGRIVLDQLGQTNLQRLDAALKPLLTPPHDALPAGHTRPTVR
jgi:thiol-disulfide isomerase/thioredoxin